LLCDSATLNDIRRGVLQNTVQGRAGFSYVYNNNSVHIDQEVWSADHPFPDQLAFGLLSFALYLYPYLRPDFGYIDELGTNEIEKADIDDRNLPFLYWANLFGPNFVRKIGETFFRDIPGWRLVDLDDGGCLYVATESYTEWRQTDQPDLVDHFRRRYRRIKKYRAIVLS
jgi:hypothetical protein